VKSGFLSVAEAPDQMVVDHAGSLHVRVNNGRAYKLEAALLEVFAETV
jgi:hypothetical protein